MTRRTWTAGIGLAIVLISLAVGLWCLFMTTPPREDW